jgi:spore maturation protein CgeB
MTDTSQVVRKLFPAVYRLHAYRRAAQVERRIAKEQRHYETITYGRIDGRPIALRLRDRLAARGIVTSPKPVGTLHIVYATRPSNWEPHNIPPQLGRFGEVSNYYYAERGFDDGEPTWLQRRHELDADLLHFVRELHRRRPIDVFLGYLSGWQVAPETIRAIGNMGIVTCAFHWDDKLSFRGTMADGRWSGPAAVAAAYDLNLTNAPSSIVKYEAEGGLAVFWPEAANPDHFKPLNLAFDRDVSFLGACYGFRPVLVDYLRRSAIKVETFGHGWPSGPLAAEDIVKLYARSRINLGFGGIGYSMNAQCLKGRDFEVPMCGALYLTSANPELAIVYDCEREIVTYSSKEDCLRTIRTLLSNPGSCDEIRKAARNTSAIRHTWQHRFFELLSLLGLIPVEESL